MAELKVKLKRKQKEEQKSTEGTEQKSSDKVALHALQKQLQVLKLKEWLILMGFIGGAALLRVPMQAIPSAEPITFFAILAGWLFGKKKGFLVGASSLYISNFLVFGGQGPWTPFQMFAFGAAGFLGGIIPKFDLSSYKKFWLKSIIPVVVISIFSTIIFDMVMNTSWSLSLGGNLPLAFITGMPFLIIHLVSNSFFSFFLPFASKLVHDKGGFNEKDICNTLIGRINGRMHKKQP